MGVKLMSAITQNELILQRPRPRDCGKDGRA